MISDIPAGTGKSLTFFYSVYFGHGPFVSGSFQEQLFEYSLTCVGKGQGQCVMIRDDVLVRDNVLWSGTMCW